MWLTWFQIFILKYIKKKKLKKKLPTNQVNKKVNNFIKYKKNYLKNYWFLSFYLGNVWQKKKNLIYRNNFFFF